MRASVVVVHELKLFQGMWDLPGPGIEPVCLPLLAGGFLSTGPPGKSRSRSREAKPCVSDGVLSGEGEQEAVGGGENLKRMWSPLETTSHLLPQGVLEHELYQR